MRLQQGKSWPRLHDAMSSVTAGLLMILVKALFTKSVDLIVYVWVYKHFHVVNLPWDSPVTWWFAFLVVDCGYYWFHRIAHEVNIFWAAHQAHHSSEEYNLSTALRQSCVLNLMLWFVYLPLALFLPPSVYVVHQQFNLLFQFWIHTEVVDDLGPLGWVLNTPSHHRVHHGRNPYCIDHNYAGVLIIWDRMFGTFEPERKGEKIVYGLVHPLASWDPLWAQFHHFVHILKCLLESRGLAHKLSILFKGPGWSPGKPRLGSSEDIPTVSPNEKPYDRTVALWLDVYVVVHFLMVMLFTVKMGEIRSAFHPLLTVVLISFLILSLTNFGLLLDHNQYCFPIEVLRLAALVMVDFGLSYHFSLLIASGLMFYVQLLFRVVVSSSLILWTLKFSVAFLHK